jgi:hypothetical protein
LHHREDGAEVAEHPSGAGRVARHEARDQARQDGRDHAQREHVQSNGEEDEAGGGAASLLDVQGDGEVGFGQLDSWRGGDEILRHASAQRVVGCGIRVRLVWPHTAPTPLVSKTVKSSK